MSFLPDSSSAFDKHQWKEQSSSLLLPDYPRAVISWLSFCAGSFPSGQLFFIVRSRWSLRGTSRVRRNLRRHLYRLLRSPFAEKVTCWQSPAAPDSLLPCMRANRYFTTSTNDPPLSPDDATLQRVQRKTKVMNLFSELVHVFFYEQRVKQILT